MKFINSRFGFKFTGGFVFAFLLFTFYLLSPFYLPAAQAHTYHTSLTRMDYNAKDKNIEITMQLFIHDVTPMLEKRLKKRVDIEKTAEVDGEILRYLSETFVFQNKKGEVQNLKWVGKEFENDVIYIYVEIPFEDAPEGMRLQNTMFFESFPEQTNLVIAHFGEKKINLLFQAGDKFKEL